MMKEAILKILGIAFLTLGFVSVAYSQQVAPKDVLPPTPQKAPVSPALSPVTPANVSQSSPSPVAVTPQTPAAPLESKPDLPVPAPVGTNKVPASSTVQPLSAGTATPSPWGRTNAVQSSLWDKPSAITNAPASAVKTATDPWSPPPSNSRVWDSTIPLNSSGTKTQWK